MGQRIPIASIVTKRTLEAGDDVEPLARSIRDSGLQIPVLVNQNYELIDGLRRIQAVRSLGQTTIEVTPVTMFGPATTWIERARVHGVEARPLSPRRIWDMYSACQPLIAVSRSHEMRGRRHGTGVHVNGRGNFLAATGINSESYLQAVTQLYRLTLEPSLRGDLAREAVVMVDRNEMSVYMGLDYVRKRQIRADILKPDDQVAMLTTTASALAGISRGMEQLGPLDPAVQDDILAGVLKDFREFRRTLHQLIHKLERKQDPR